MTIQYPNYFFHNLLYLSHHPNNTLKKNIKIAEEKKKNDGKKEKIAERKTMKMKGKPEIFKKNGQFIRFFYFVTYVVNIFPIYYIYKN